MPSFQRWLELVGGMVVGACEEGEAVCCFCEIEGRGCLVFSVGWSS
ncbi:MULTISPECIES: hypothetical protein [Bartonella]|nr:hypothetical protein [Bartonella capreoli]